jgi:MFS family permease
MGLGFAAASMAPTVWVAAAFVVVAAAGNGGALVCNVLLVQRGAPDRLRGRAFTLIMSTNYALLGVGMAVAGPLTDAVGGRWMWGIAGAVFLAASAVAFAMARGVSTEGVAEAREVEAPVEAALAEPRQAAVH